MIDFILSYWWFVLILFGMFVLNGLFVTSVIKSFDKDKIEKEIKKSPAYIMVMMMSMLQQGVFFLLTWRSKDEKLLTFLSENLRFGK